MSLACALAVSVALAAPDAGQGRPLEYDRPIAAADLEGRTLRELSLMRNSIYARAGNVFRKKWLHDHFSAQPWYQGTGLDAKKVTPLGKANAEAIVKYELAIPKERLRQQLTVLANDFAVAEGDPKKRAAIPKEQLLESMLLAEAIGVEPPDQVFARGVASDRDPFVTPELLDQKLAVAQLSDLSPRELRILRNMVFARRGRVFTSESLKRYFATKKWYREDPRYTDKRLTAVDKENIKLIRSLEQSLGGAMTEADVQAEDLSGA